MKTVMKKLLSVMLVAVMLVSAIPFQASAAEPQGSITVSIKIGGNQVLSQHPLEIYSFPTTGEAILKYRLTGYSGYEVDRVWDNVNKKEISSINNQDDITIFLKEKTVTEPEPTETQPTEHTHQYVETSREAATCTKDGKIIKTCSICGDVQEEAIAATGHSWGEWTVSKEATETEKGEEKRVCSVCKEEETRGISATGYTLYFYSDSNVSTISNVTSGSTINDLPTPEAKAGYKFVGWYTGKNGTGEKLEEGFKWYDEMGQEFYAYYKESTDDGVSTLTVYAKYYVDGSLKDIRELYSKQFNDGANMFSWLVKNESTTSDAIFEYVSAEDYEWEPRYYYTYSGNEPLEEQDLIADGNKSIVVKVYGKERTKANVLLYVHKEKTSSPTAIYEMNGYTAGDSVTRAAVTTEVKKHYTGKNMTIQGLYTDTTWKQLLNGENPTPSNSITVKDNGTLRIHVLLKNATAGSGSSNADTTNPKTGDTIFVPVIFMLVSGAAIATVYAVSKKRSVK